MRQITKYALAGLLALTGLGLASETATAAQPPVGYPPQPYPPRPYPPRPYPPQPCPPRPMDTDYIILVRHGHHWDRYGRYETLHQARRVEFMLERQGYAVRVVPVRDYTPDFPWGIR